MQNRRFDDLELRLVQEGAAPRYVKRVIRELDDHAADLVKDLVGQGLSKGDAELQARKKIGSDETLAKEIMSRPFARSLVARFPYIAFTIGPFIMGAVVLGVTLLLFIGLVNWGESNFGWSKASIASILRPHHIFSSYILVPLVSAFFVWLAHTRACPIVWTFVSLAILAAMGGLLFDTSIVFPTEASNEGHYSVTFYWNGYVYSFWRLFAPLVILSGYLGWLKFRAQPTT